MASIAPKYALFYSRLSIFYLWHFNIDYIICMNGSARARPNTKIKTLRFFLSVDSFNTPKVSILCLRFSELTPQTRN